MIVCTNDKNLENSIMKFELEIYSDKRLESVKSNINYNLKRKTFEIFGKWDNNNAGGNPSDSTFNKNPHYEISVSKTTDCYIELVSNNNFLVSMILKELPYKENTMLNTEYKDKIMCFKTRLISGKKYILIPFTNNRNNVLLLLT